MRYGYGLSGIVSICLVLVNLALAGDENLFSGSGHVSADGKTMEVKSAVASVRGSEMFVTVYPFAFTADERRQIREGDKKRLLYFNNMLKRPSPDTKQWKDWSPYFWITLSLDPKVEKIDKSAIRSFDFTFGSFAGKGSNTGTGLWVKKYTTIEKFEVDKLAKGGSVVLEMKVKENVTFNWDIAIKVDTTIYKN